MNDNLNSIAFKIKDFEKLKFTIDDTISFQEQLQKIAHNADFELKYSLVRLFIHRIFINYDEFNETYGIELIDLGGSYMLKLKSKSYQKKAQIKNSLD